MPKTHDLTIDETNYQTETILALSDEGVLSKAADGRWIITFPDGSTVKLTSGTVCEIKLGESWIPTRIESHNGEYYAVTKGLCLRNGLKARILCVS